MYWQTGELFKKNWKDEPYTFHLHSLNASGTATLTSTFEMDWNLYFNPDRKREEVKFGGGTWSEWQGRGKDVHSLYADPLFVDPEQGDFRLKAESPVWALGFRPIDLSQVGPRTAAGVQAASRRVGTR